VVVKAEPYDYLMPLEHTAVIMIDFQKDFMLKGGFGDALGNDVGLLKVSSLSLEFDILGMSSVLEARRAFLCHS
jgi:nicotinamidase-related amidase